MHRTDHAECDRCGDSVYQPHQHDDEDLCTPCHAEAQTNDKDDRHEPLYPWMR